MIHAGDSRIPKWIALLRSHTLPCQCRAPRGRPRVAGSQCSSPGRTCCTHPWRPPQSLRILRHLGALQGPPCSLDTGPRWAGRPSGSQSCSGLGPAVWLGSGLYWSAGTRRRGESELLLFRRQCNKQSPGLAAFLVESGCSNEFQVVMDSHQSGVLGSHASSLHQELLVTKLHTIQPSNSLQEQQGGRRKKKFYKVLQQGSILWNTDSPHEPCNHVLPAQLVTWSLRLTSTYSQNAYPLDKPVALSFTRLKAFNGPNDVSSSFTWNIIGGSQSILRGQKHLLVLVRDNGKWFDSIKHLDCIKINVLKDSFLEILWPGHHSGS